jgi:hypothetical protein
MSVGFATITGSATTTSSPLFLTGAVSGSATSTGMISVGTLNYTDTNNFAVFTDNVNNYSQFIVQNKNSGNAASSDIIVSNDLSGATNYYGDFGVNSSTFTGGGPFDDANGVYLYASYGTLSIGTNDIDDFRIATGVTTGNPATRVTVKGVTGNVGIGSTLPTSKLVVTGDTNVSGALTAGKIVCTDGGIFSGVVTATSYTGSGTNLTGIVTSLVAGSNISLSGSTGQVTITATGAGGRTLVSKTTDESITSDNTLNNDSQLFFTMAANTKYQFKLEVFFDTGATPDFKWRHTGPAAPTLVRIVERDSAPGSGTLSFSIATAYSTADNTLTTTSGTTGGYVTLEGIIHNGANAGDFQFQWSQNSSSVTATTVRAGSYIEYGVVA